jgi:stage II sporulation protein D
MRKIVFSLMALIMLVLVQPVSGAEAAVMRPIKIGLATNEDQVILNVADTVAIIDLANPEPVNLPIPGEQVLFTACGDQIALNYIPISSGPLLVIPSGSFFTWDAHRYRGGILIAAKNNRLNLIDYVSLEDYLRGVVPREVMASWPPAALKAQAIAARTYAISSLGRHDNNGFDLCPTDHCQVYGGMDAEKASTDVAVTSTAGEVITYKGKVISAVYHSSSGGYTLDPVTVWNFSVPYLKPMVDWDQNAPYAQWTRYMNWEELQGLAMRYYPSLGRLQRISSLSYGQDGKLLKITLRGDLAENTISGEQFRTLVGLPSVKVQIGVIYGPAPVINLWWLPNSLFPQSLMANDEVPGLIADVLTPPWDLPDPWSWLQDKEPIRMVLRGSGWGHGVGLSQWGAKGMAEAGYNERQILEHYYPGAAVTDIANIRMDGSQNNAGQ